MHAVHMRRALAVVLVLLLLVVVTPSRAGAITYLLSSDMETGHWNQPFEGLLSLGNPSTYNLGDSRGGVSVDFYSVSYGITGAFIINNMTYTFNGVMKVQDQGAGLWDTSFFVPVTGPTGQSYIWESINGAFFYPDWQPYPSAQAFGGNSLAYTEPPASILFYSSTITPVSGGLAYLGFGGGTIVAKAVPEPSGVVLLGIGLIAFAGFQYFSKLRKVNA